MSTIADLIQQLNSTSGETLHRVIQELGERGSEAREAIHPLVMLVRFSEDRVARGHALLAIGQIDPSQTDVACVVDDIGDLMEAIRKAANQLSPEQARILVTLYLEMPIGWLRLDSPTLPDVPEQGDLSRIRGHLGEHLLRLALDVDNHARPFMLRNMWIEEIVRRHLFLIPDLVGALTSEDVVESDLGERDIGDILSDLGKEHSEVVDLLIPLFDHESVAVRHNALCIAAMTGRMPVELLPRLFDAVNEANITALDLAFVSLLEEHPREIVAALLDSAGAPGLNLLRTAPGSLSPASLRALVEELILLLYSSDVEIRRTAAIWVSWMKPEATPALPRLRELLGDNETEVREQAKAAIQRIEGPSDLST